MTLMGFIIGVDIINLLIRRSTSLGLMRSGTIILEIRIHQGASTLGLPLFGTRDIVFRASNNRNT